MNTREHSAILKILIRIRHAFLSPAADGTSTTEGHINVATWGMDETSAFRTLQKIPFSFCLNVFSELSVPIVLMPADQAPANPGDSGREGAWRPSPPEPPH